jgi:large subunit ribosomal protein L21
VSYAIVKVGGKQYRVEEGDSILVDRMRADEGDKVELEPLLFADGDKSVLDAGGVKVQAVVTGHEKGKKIHGLKFKPKLHQGWIVEEEGIGWLIRRGLDRAGTAATRTPSASA